MKIYWATRLRGFLKHVSNGSGVLDFVDNCNYYETNNLKSKLLSELIHFKIFDYLGIFQVLKSLGKDCDMYASFNRFLTCDKPYFIYLENPTALYHYVLDRASYPFGRKRFQKALNDPNLKGIFCMSNACRDSFAKINGQLPDKIVFDTLYPLVPDNTKCDVETIKVKSHRDQLRLLFCVQGVRFVSKGGLEILAAFERLIEKQDNVCLTVITKLDDVDTKIIDRIRTMKNVELFDFTFQYGDLENIYADTNILLQPTSDDSFGLTVLEAMKGGCAIIASSLYAMPEMVTDGENGYLVEPKYWFFDKDNVPNPKVWNHRRKTIYSTQVSQCLVDELYQLTMKLNEDRDLLERMSRTSYMKANGSGKFGEKVISHQWEEQLMKLRDVEKSCLLVV